MRLPIAGTKERYETGIMEIHDLISNGKTEDEVVHALNNKYTERDIRGLTGRIKMMYEMEDYPKLKLLLKVILWFFLITKVFGGVSLIIENDVLISWGILLIMIISAVNILSLVLVHKETENAYAIVMALGFISLNSEHNYFNEIMGNDGIPVQIISLLEFCSIFLLLFTSFFLNRKFPNDLLRIKKIVNKNNVMVGAAD